MGLFKKFEEQALNKVNKFANKEEFKLDENKFKRPDNYSNIILPDDNLNKENSMNGNYNDSFYNDSFMYDDPINLYPTQKPESFHFFILENQYQDLERLIRGVKDVYDKDKERWVIKRKADHCFTDEESEEIVRTAQSHLSSDIKLAIFNRDEYPILLNAIYDQLWVLFKGIMDYRFGRFGNVTNQHKMKQQATNIFNALMMRIKANYSRAIDGRENKATHEGISGQESLQQTDRKKIDRFSYT